MKGKYEVIVTKEAEKLRFYANSKIELFNTLRRHNLLNQNRMVYLYGKAIGDLCI
jgi:hypothetical protein